MKVLLLIAFAIVATNALSVTNQWISFKANHGKWYENDVEENLRFEIFQSNLKKIEEHNAKYERGESSYYKGVTKFADMTVEEFKNMLLRQMKTKPEITGTPVSFFEDDVPEFVDWRESGAVLEVKDQGQCGSCWAFSATGALEGQNFIKNGISTSLSEQELVDCSGLFNNLGCNGGMPTAAFDYVLSQGIASEENYPYKAITDKCHHNASNTVVKIKDYKIVKEATVESLKKTVATVGPISIPVVADENIQLYKGGIFDELTCNGIVNHAVLLVGYGNENGTEFWTIKNSWSTGWGEDGYYRLLMHPVICQILHEPTYPVLK